MHTCGRKVTPPVAAASAQQIHTEREVSGKRDGNLC